LRSSGRCRTPPRGIPRQRSHSADNGRAINANRAHDLCRRQQTAYSRYSPSHKGARGRC
jgi:hypothetical protein